MNTPMIDQEKNSVPSEETAEKKIIAEKILDDERKGKERAKNTQIQALWTLAISTTLVFLTGYFFFEMTAKMSAILAVCGFMGLTAYMLNNVPPMKGFVFQDIIFKKLIPAGPGLILIPPWCKIYKGYSLESKSFEVSGKTQVSGNFEISYAARILIKPDEWRLWVYATRDQSSVNEQVSAEIEKIVSMIIGQETTESIKHRMRKISDQLTREFDGRCSKTEQFFAIDIERVEFYDVEIPKSIAEISEQTKAIMEMHKQMELLTKDSDITPSEAMESILALQGKAKINIFRGDKKGNGYANRAADGAALGAGVATQDNKGETV